MLYARALESEDLRAARRDCRSIIDEGVGGDCLVAVSIELAPQQGIDPEDGCPQVPAGVWQDECWFMAAEYWREQKRDPDRGAALCEKAGEFAEDCAQHLWQTSIRKATWKKGSGAMVDQLPTMKRNYCRWVERVGHYTDIENRFWQRFYGSVFEGERSLDLSICADLPTELDREHCRAAGANTMKVRIHMHSPNLEQRDTFCAGEPTVEGIADQPFGDAIPDPLLDDAILEMHEAICGEPDEAHLGERHPLPTDTTQASAPIPCP